MGERNDEWDWVFLYKDEVEVIFAKPNEHTPFEQTNFHRQLLFKYR